MEPQAPAPATTLAERVAKLHRIDAACDRLGIGRSTLYGLMKSGQLRSVKVGKSRLIPESAICEFVAALEADAANDLEVV